MSKHEKLLEKLQSEPTPKDVSWRELSALLGHFGYELKTGAGSRRKFIHPVTKHVISLHEPHPQPTIKPYCIRDVLGALRDAGLIPEGEK